MSERRDVAFHEAAHACTALACGFRIRRVTIVKRWTRDACGARVLAAGETHLAHAFFGALARRRASLDHVVSFIAIMRAPTFVQDEHGSRLDREHARFAANDWAGRDREAARAVLALGRRRAKRLVQEHRGAIHLVARALLSRETLSGDEVRRIIRRGKR